MTTTSSSSPAPPATPRAVADALDEAAAAIAAARTMLDQGGAVELKGLEDHVERACASIADLPASDRQSLKPALISLIDALNALTGDLKRQHEALSEALQDINSRRQAISAYKPRGSR